MILLRSLRSQISLSILFVLLVMGILISALVYVIVNRQFEAYTENQVNIRSESIVANIGHQYNAATATWNLDYLHAAGMYALYDGYILTVYDASGQIVWDAESHDMTLCEQIMEDISARMRQWKNNGGFVSKTYDLTQDEQVIGSISVRYYGPYFFSENDVRFIDTLHTVLFLIGLLSLFFALLAGHLLARRIARPVTEAAAIAKQIANGDYEVQWKHEIKTGELNQLISAINELAAQLGKQETLRRQLTANVSHELRTPLAAIGSHLEAMVEGVWEMTPERLKSCHEEVERLSHLVSDLECLAKVEGDNLKLNKTPVNLLEIADSAVATLDTAAAKKSILLAVAGIPTHVPADKDRIRQVLINLLSNAIKYTPSGGHIRVEVKDTPFQGILIVEDDGTGIAEEELPFIFERFYRTDKSRNRKTGGAGIGLAIVKSIVMSHGGTVTAESRENQGSRFTVSLPKEE